jgi:hypothetical protein
MNENDEHNHILDAATPFRAGQPRLPEVLEGSGQYRPKAAANIDKNSGITNGTVRIGDSCSGFEGPKLTALGNDKIGDAPRPFEAQDKVKFGGFHR